jgi:hypothetical protein
VESRGLSTMVTIVLVSVCFAVGLGVALAASSGSAGYSELGLLAVVLRELRSIDRWQ